MTDNRLVIQSQNSFKLAIKGSILAPLVYYAYVTFQRLIKKLKGLSDSRKNMAAINTMSSKRQMVLISEQHRAWLCRSNVIDDLPGIDICVVTHNSAELLDSYINSLLAQDYPCNKISIYFVDNNSFDQTIEKLELFQREFQSQFRAFNIYQKSSQIIGGGLDFAIRQGQSDYMLISSIDIIYHKDAIIKVVAMALSDDEQVATWELRQKPYEISKYYDPVTLETSYSSHTCVLMRRAVYNNVGGYEPKLLICGDNIELSYRFRRAGYILKYVPSAIVQLNLDKKTSEDNYLSLSNSLLSNAYIRLCYGDWYDKLLIFPLQLTALIRGAGFKGSRRLIIKNLMQLIKNFLTFFEIEKNNNDIFFPFRGKDFELDREGDCYECRELDSNNLPLVSIVTRTYKGRQFWLKECIASVLNQTYPNIQHVIVEDGGDDMLPLVEEVKQAYNGAQNITYKSLTKLGRSRAGNEGLLISKGQWVMFLDDDDLLMPDHVEVLVNELQNNEEIDAAYTLAWDVVTVMKNSQNVIAYTEMSYETPDKYFQNFSLDVLLYQNYIPIQAILFKKALYDEYGGFDEEVEYLEDWLLWTKYAINHRFKFVKKTTSLFRTPYVKSELIRRKIKLDSVYNVVMSKQHEILSQYQH
ncbi:MAG: glycosyltransferase [gamma proteobacterium symbiont of Bathyaustriella thionipta]|nr:glycosyltransferase [gamma proteobacterium symbiont of Bathyaustriella thionipta]MCU7949337.1 glycosyltransferase [gamma proteobacterium symbiont of Bathyaustriella thionipta]MCU7952661.1 glycosyltransferase [gamma proteobacterium symbiont of Bathyaustriella thionipta]MCU7955538.1 glycosyltransferase [gamma proteobacterium symbiont of Bathyaustriella thionipta]MCU7968293.1 glycosyltransferase [gamma proteobacterium symbiont of Bathyaustriella thionipta]